MKNKLLKSLLAGALLMAPALTSCESVVPSSTQPSVVETFHLVSFYVDDTLFNTARVKDGDVVKEMATPRKEGFVFKGWEKEDHTPFIIGETVVNGDMRVNAKFEEKIAEGVRIDVEQEKIEGKEYLLVIGWYAKTATSHVSKEDMEVFASNLVSYLKARSYEDEEIVNVSIRPYGVDKNVADTGVEINNDADVDLLLGVGKNITSTGGVTVIDRNDEVTMRDGSNRSMALVSDNVLAKELYDYIIEANAENSMLNENFDISKTNPIPATIYTVNFFVDENVFNSVEVEEGNTIEQFADPIKEGYSFIKWIIDEESDFVFNTTVINSDLSVYAVFEIIQVNPELKDVTVTFMIEDAIHDTKIIKEGSLVQTVEEVPLKHNYRFVGWFTSDDIEFIINETVVDDNLTVYAKYELCLDVNDTFDALKEYTLVIGWYGKTSTSGLNDEVMNVFATNLVSYLKARLYGEEQIAKVSIRRYGDSNTDVASMGALINSDGDVDLMVGVGGNITSTGGVTNYGLESGINMGGKSRNIALTSTSALADQLFDYIVLANEANSMFSDTFDVLNTDVAPLAIHTLTFMVDEDIYATREVKDGKTCASIDAPIKEGSTFLKWVDSEDNEFVFGSTVVTSNLILRAVFETISEDDIVLNIRNSKEADTVYPLVIGWYGKTDTSGLNDANMTTFASNLVAFLRASNVADEDIERISIRCYAETGKVAALASEIVADGDVDLILGGGGNITSQTGLESAVTSTGLTMGAATSRVVAELGTNALATLVRLAISSNDATNNFFTNSFSVENLVS